MPLGAGIAPAGSAPAGFGSPDVAQVPSKVIWPDPVTGLSQTAAKLDARTGQPTFDALGRRQGMSGIQQMVLLRAKTIRGSSVIANLGLQAASGVIGPNTQRQLADAFAVAMADIVAQKLIKILSVTVDQFSQSGEYVIFRWQDLTTADPSTPTLEQVTRL